MITSAAFANGTVYCDDVDVMTMVSTIEKVPLTPNKAPVRLARGIQGAGSIAVASQTVFWADATCALQSVSADP
jgi:hypothetical protein